MKGKYIFTDPNKEKTNLLFDRFSKEYIQNPKRDKLKINQVG